MPRRGTYHHCVEIDVSDVLSDLTNAELIEECRARDIWPEPKQDDAKRDDDVEQARYEFDTLIHDLREAFLSRDQRHMDVLLIRLEARYREIVPA